MENQKFVDPLRTGKGEERAWVSPRELKTLWFNTGTICNLSCHNCYIESTPKNDRLAFIDCADVASYLEELECLGWAKPELGFTGGEPFANPNMIEILRTCLQGGYTCLVLTNATQPLWRVREQLAELAEAYGEMLKVRVSLDHYSREVHEQERGPKSWDWAIKGLNWLTEKGIQTSIAGRSLVDEPEEVCRVGFQKLFTKMNWGLQADDLDDLVIFAEMDLQKDVPEITTQCWGILHKSPDDIMCASSRMVVKDRGAEDCRVVACTLLPYDNFFSLGKTLHESWRDVRLKHAYCAQFCVLGGSSCSQ